MSTLKVTNIQHGSATNVAMVLDSAGTVKAYSTISVGNATPSSSGAGITFPATASASSDANTLDDYEEGTWTATQTSSSNITGTPSYSQATYTKIGRVVTLQIRIDVNVTTANTTSYVVFTGAPFVQSQIATAFGLANNAGKVINGQIYSSGTIFVGAPAASELSSGTDIWYATLIYIV